MENNLAVSFSTLVASLSASALSCMGEEIDNIPGKINLDMAQFNIALIKMLHEKTKNNLSQEEDVFISSALHDLQSKFINLSK